jgi:hypothetical protein
MLMGRTRVNKILSVFRKHPISVLLFIIIGTAIADLQNFQGLKGDIFNILGIFALLILMNIGIFRLLGLHLALKRTKKVKYWTFAQKCKLTLYLFVTLMMFAPHNIIGGLLYLSFFIGLIYFIFKGIWRWYKNINFVISSSEPTKVNFMAIEEIDRMDGRQFELFLSKLYDGLGYFSEVTPQAGDFGADVITVKDKTKTAIQAKCFGEGQSVGVEAINEVCGGAGYWNAQNKIVITNRYFTKSAILSAERNHVKLIDRDGLQLLLREYRDSLENKNLFRFFPLRKQSNN